MEKEFVPFDLAVKLKELGFDELCLGWFTTLGNLVIKENVRNSHVHETNTAAPVWQQAFDWFMEQGNLSWIDENDETFRYNIQFTFVGSILGLQGFRTYEQARCACLEKLIEIVSK